MYVLGIETSCDETAAAIVSEDRRVLSNIVLSQVADHEPYGGVVPEIAARAHISHMEAVLQQALDDAGMQLNDVDAIAATGGPGLIGGVMVGVMTGKALAAVHKKPFVAVNHLEGHALTVRLTDNVPFPYLLLLVSGGHCQFLLVRGVGQYEKLGATLDDALGEAFDKTAKLLGMPYPGGPAVEKLALQGNPHAYNFPVPMKGRDDCNFSFSGLKTAVRTLVVNKTGETALTDAARADICASFQYTVAQSLSDRTTNAIARCKSLCPDMRHFVLAGGVAANQYLRGELSKVVETAGLKLVAPPLKLCTDNAAMIAWAGVELFKAGNVHDLDFEPRARWPLT
ncbi:MAG: tRNA (adenosine(37)-N6)-threonylcarbamoyltransferase complex transferase subunit TsaD [Alphaproteobacteria bacterium]